MPNAFRISMAVATALTLTACVTGRHTYRDAIVTDRPDFTESPAPVPVGAVQVEAGDTFERTDDVRANTAGEVLLRVGLLPRAELRIGLNSIVATQATTRWSPAREDATLGTKVQLIGEREGRHLLPATSLLFATTVPTGSAGVRQSALTPEAKLALGWSLAETWGLSSNLNVASVPEAGSRAAETVASLSLDHDLSDRYGSYVEWYGARSHGALGSQYVNAGVTRLFGPNAQLDLRAGAGVARARGDFFVGLGIARRW